MIELSGAIDYAPQVMKIAVIIPVAGLGRRMGEARPKQYLELAGRPLVCHTLKLFRHVENVLLVAEPGKTDLFRTEILQKYDFPAWEVVEGGKKRQDSVRNGLNALMDDCDVVLVHDGVRPFVTPEKIQAVTQRASETGAAILAVPVRDTIKQVADSVIKTTVDRTPLWQAQTPQAFHPALLRRAFDAATTEGFYGTDEASLVERLGEKVAIVPGDDRNMKITTPEDFALAALLLQEEGK